nr:DMT family transporter [Bacteriovorax sp. HI3]
MNLIMLLPLMIGSVGILQGTINRHVATHIGVAQATLISNAVTVLICIAFYALVKSVPSLVPDFFQVKAPLTTYKWWFIFPPIFGFCIVTGIPLAFAKLGAVKVTVLLVAAQMVTSVVWDIFVEDIGLNMMKFAGILCALVSVVLITLSKN